MSSPLNLLPPALRPLPLGTVRPTGWLHRQLRLQGDGLSGALDEFWPDIKDSRWFGGQAEGWERAPYWLDGLIPLAWLLDDARLRDKAQRHVNELLARQQEDGWLSPLPASQDYDTWSTFLVLKVLVQYHDVTGDVRVVNAVTKCLRRLERHLDGAPLSRWGQFRWFESLLSVWWLYDLTGERWLLDLAVKLHAQGFDWRAFFAHWPLTTPTAQHQWTYMGHVVNNAMALKAPGLWWRLSGDPGDRAAVYDLIEKLDRHHGTVTGVFTGDECLAGRDPVQGTELCAVVEYLFSLEVLCSLFADAALGDRLERIAFNALPATLSSDLWAHQYDQQVNQIACVRQQHPVWNTNGPESNLFGLEPGYGCCTANFSQGWPKFAAHLWMRTADDGLAAVAHAPCTVQTTVRGAPVTVSVTTDYPFRSTLSYRVSVGRPVRFPLWLRIPAWAAATELTVAGEATLHPAAGRFYVLDREWQGETTITLELPMTPEAVRRHHDALAITRGPLVYSLRMGEDWQRVNADKPCRELPHGDWEVVPTTPWNYALEVSELTVARDLTFTEQPVGDSPFSRAGAPVAARAYGRRVPDWQLTDGRAGELPVSPVIAEEPREELTLIPYGCAKLRVTEFPTLSAPLAGFAPDGTPLAFDLRADGAAVTFALRPLGSGTPGVITHCRLSRVGGALHLDVAAWDPDLTALIATGPDGPPDRYLYEEDCIQLALARPGNAAPEHFLLINALGRRGGAAREWPVTARRDPTGWNLHVECPVPADEPLLGFSLHRFFRGIRGEVHGCGDWLPHPLDLTRFVVLVMAGTDDLANGAAAYRNAIQATLAQATGGVLDAARQRLARAQARGGLTASLATAQEYARRRSQQAVPTGERGLCWDEGHFLHSLVDLYDLDGNPAWVDLAITRANEVWALRADRRDLADRMWRRALPTWYNDSETGTACTLVTGVIIWPIARLLRLVQTRPELAARRERVAGWVPLLEESIGWHDFEWVDLPHGAGMYLEPYLKGPGRVYPSGGSRINPLNRAFALAMPMLDLARLTGSAEYLRKVTAMARFFRQHCDDNGGAGLAWEYEVASCLALGEDLDHASMQLCFAEQCAAEGIIWTEEDIRAIARTFAGPVFRYGDVPCGTLRGYLPGLNLGVGVWSKLTRFVPELFPRLVTIVETVLRERDPEGIPEGWAVRNLVVLEQARRTAGH